MFAGTSLVADVRPAAERAGSPCPLRGDQTHRPDGEPLFVSSAAASGGFIGRGKGFQRCACVTGKESASHRRVGLFFIFYVDHFIEL